jgi:transcription elongation GreA/GreB family factor
LRFPQAMEKTSLISAIITQLEADLAQASDAALESAESATHEEARAESKYDTRGLETSYLASGQARHALELKESLDAIRNFTLPTFDRSSPIALGAIVTTLSSNGRETYFLVPGIGGIELSTEQGPLTVITSKSPIGSELIGKQTGDRIQAGGGKSIIRIS